MKTLIRSGKVIDPANGIDHEKLDLLIADSKIVRIGKDIPANDVNVIDAKGLIVVPGLIDMHVHLREPGQEHKETIQTGTKAASKGGFTSVLAMANTTPVTDNSQVVRHILSQAEKNASVNVFTVGSATIGLLGKTLVNVGELVDSGVVALSDDGKPIMDRQLMKDALLACKRHNIPLLDHSEWIDEKYDGWVMNEGEVSKRLCVKGIPNSVEERMIARDIEIAGETGAHLHICHVSTAGSVELVRQAKKKGINVTAEATPHHFTLTDEAVEKCGANAKMNPPLRSQRDVDAVIEGLKDGTIDVIATDHAPHAEYEKAKGLHEAPFGIIGLETCLALVITELVNKGHLALDEAIAKMTINPAKILNLKKGTLSEGADADITIIDIDKEWTVNPEKFESKGRNTPFAGWKLRGLAVIVMKMGGFSHNSANRKEIIQ